VEEKAALEALAASRDRGEADRARALLLTLEGGTSPRIAEVFRVREDTVRLWRSDFARGGVEAVKASVYAGPPPVKTECRGAQSRMIWSSDANKIRVSARITV
jgi:transposase